MARTREEYPEWLPAHVPRHWLSVLPSLVCCVAKQFESYVPASDLPVLRRYSASLREDLRQLLSLQSQRPTSQQTSITLLQYSDDDERSFLQRWFYPVIYHLGNGRSVRELFLFNPLGLALLCCAGKLDLASSSSDNVRLRVPSKRSRSGSSDSDRTIDLAETPSPSPALPSGEWESMPSDLNAYYHTVVYFSHSRSSADRSSERVDLGELVDILKRYISARKREFTTNILVAEHFFANDLDAIRHSRIPVTIREGNVEIPAIPEPTAFIEPHLHVVWFRNSNNRAYGVEGQLGKWAEKFGAKACLSSAKVKCVLHRVI